jgi:hypothetical protein
MLELTAKCVHHYALNGYSCYYLAVTYTRPYKFLLLCCTIFITWKKNPYIFPEA